MHIVGNFIARPIQIVNLLFNHSVTYLQYLYVKFGVES